MQFTYIFLRFILTIAIQLRIVNAQEASQTYQNGCLYDFYQERLKNLQSNYQSNPLKVEDCKRSLEAKYIGLYDEFKKRLDTFNAALVVDENGQPQEDKRSVGSQSLYDRFKNRLYNKENEFKKISVEEKVKDDNEGLVVKESTVDKKDTKSIKAEPQTINKSKMSISSTAVHEVEPGSRHDEFMKHKDIRNHRSSDGQNGVYYNDDQEQDENSSFDHFNINHFRTKNRNLEKRNDREGEEESQEFNDKQELEEKNIERSRFKNFAIEEELPFGTNKWSLYPRIFTKHTHIHLPTYLYTNGSKLLQNYSQKMNITAFELAKKLVRLKDTNFIKTTLELINESGKAKQIDRHN